MPRAMSGAILMICHEFRAAVQPLWSSGALPALRLAKSRARPASMPMVGKCFENESQLFSGGTLYDSQDCRNLSRRGAGLCPERCCSADAANRAPDADYAANGSDVAVPVQPVI